MNESVRKGEEYPLLNNLLFHSSLLAISPVINRVLSVQCRRRPLKQLFSSPALSFSIKSRSDFVAAAAGSPSLESSDFRTIDIVIGGSVQTNPITDQLSLAASGNTFKSIMSWQSYVDDQLLATKSVSNAVICGHDGNIWAKSGSFAVSP